jgi:maltooligosyltrehalose synthase
MTVAPRLVVGADGRWQGTRICVPPGSWTNVLTTQPIEGGDLELCELWRDFPVALLERLAKPTASSSSPPSHELSRRL